MDLIKLLYIGSNDGCWPARDELVGSINPENFWPAELQQTLRITLCIAELLTGLSKKMDGIWNRYNLKSTGRIYTFGVLKCSEKFKVLDLP